MITTLALASLAAFALAVLSAVAGFGGGVLLLPVFTAMFGLRVAVPVLTITQLASNGGRVWFNRHDLRWGLIARFSAGAVPLAVVGALVLAAAPLATLSGCWGSSSSSWSPGGTWDGGRSRRRVRAAYVGTEAACALTMHFAKIVGYGAGSLLGTRVLLLGAALIPATLAGAWCGRALVGRMSERVFVILVEAGLVVAAVLFLVGL